MPEDKRWKTVTGGITHEQWMGTYVTVINLGGVDRNGNTRTVCLGIEDARLARKPATFERALNQSVRDLAVHGIQ